MRLQFFEVLLQLPDERDFSLSFNRLFSLILQNLFLSAKELRDPYATVKDFWRFVFLSSSQLKLRSSPSGFCGTRPLQQKCHIPSLGTRRSTALRTEMQVWMLHRKDFIENLCFAAPTVPRKGFTADEELRASLVCNIAVDYWRFGFRSRSFHLGENLCP